MEYKIPESLADIVSQSEAAAFAVLCAHVRQGKDSPESQECSAFLKELEMMMCESITHNDGNVVHWIGTAAKQMNPLLS